MIEQASATIEQLEEELRQEHERRYAFRTMLAATDRVLWELEKLNLRGVKKLPKAVGLWIRPALAELPESCLEPLVGGKVQDVLDSVFEVQDRLFRFHDPDRPAEEQESGG